MRRFTAVFLLAPALAFAAPGSFDRFFGQDGWALLPPGPVTDRATGADFVTIDALGRLLAIGNVPRPTDGPDGAVPVLARFLADGTPDTTFAGTGYFHPSPRPDLTGIGTKAFPVADGRTLLVEQRSTLCWPPRPACSLAVATHFLFAQRLEPGGGIDPAYGVMATVSTDIVQEDVVAAPDGSLTAVGYQHLPALPAEIPVRRFDVRAFEADGQISLPWIPARPAFDCAGDNLSEGTARLARQPDGRLLVAQQFSRDGRFFICLTRLHPDATLDTTFGAGGRMLIDDPRFLALGPATIRGLHARPGGGAILFAEPLSIKGARLLYVAWLTDSGSPDPSRGVQGVVGPLTQPVYAVEAVAVEPNGRILLAGFPLDPLAQSPFPSADLDRPRIARLDAFGALDRSFGPTGEGFAPLATTSRRLWPRHIRPGAHGEVFIAGRATATGTSVTYDRFAVAKLRGDPPPPSSGGWGCSFGFVSGTGVPPDPSLPALVLAAAALPLARTRRRR